MAGAFVLALGSAFAFKPKPAHVFSGNKNLFEQILSPRSCSPIVCSDDLTRPHCVADLSKLYQFQTNSKDCNTPETDYQYTKLP